MRVFSWECAQVWAVTPTSEKSVTISNGRSALALSMSPPHERRALQCAVAILSLIPIGAGLAGCLYGLDVFDAHAQMSRDLGSHGRYLSGLLLGIGLCFWSCIPAVETHGPRARVLTAIVVIGGLARLYAIVQVGWPGAGMIAALVMELVVTPCLALWRERVERLSQNAGPTGHH